MRLQKYVYLRRHVIEPDRGGRVEWYNEKNAN